MADEPLTNPKALAGRGEHIYQEKYKGRYESEYSGKFVAIDVRTEKAYIADSAVEALEAARKDSPRGLFHLIKVGAAGAFRVSYTNRNASLDWLS